MRAEEQEYRYTYTSSNALRALKYWKIDESRSKVYFTETEDHWQLAITRYPPKIKIFPYPILLCHGLGSNRLAFHAGTSNSMGEYFASFGFDVYACDLRGHGLSEKPRIKNKKRYGWGISEYATEDLPSIINAILYLSAADQCYFIGHSMGGILLYYLASEGESRIKRGIAIGSSLDYSGTGSWFKYIAAAAPFSHLLPTTPIHWPARVSGFLSRYYANAIDPLLANPKNIQPRCFSQFTCTATHSVSSKVLRDLALAITGAGVVNGKGEKVSTTLIEHGYPFPVLAVSGSKDLQCPPEAACRFGTDHMIFGKQYGHREEYGHHDLLIGKHVTIEVWPRLFQWLIAN